MIKVMLVEDEIRIRQGIKVLLEEVIQGFTVMWEANHGARALEILKVAIPDVLITDVRMQVMDGIRLIKHLREMYPELPVVIISGYDEFEYARQAMKLGVKDYLLKPVNRSEFALVFNRLREEYSPAVQPPGGDPLPADSKLVTKIRDMVERNLDQDISLQSASQALQLHPNYFSQRFKKETGENFSDYVLKVRINRAKQLLSQTQLKVYDITRMIGYQSPKHFATVFKRETGMSPNAYRAAKS